MIDLTVTISAILGIAAIVSPIATAIINNRYQLKIKKMELADVARQRREQRIIDIYDRYAIAAGACIVNATDENMAAFGAASAKAMLYAPARIVPQMQQLYKWIEDSQGKSAADALAEVIKALRGSV